MRLTFEEWWDEGVGKPIDVAYDCAKYAWYHQAKTIHDLLSALEDIANYNATTHSECAAQVLNENARIARAAIAKVTGG